MSDEFLSRIGIDKGESLGGFFDVAAISLDSPKSPSSDEYCINNWFASLNGTPEMYTALIGYGMHSVNGGSSPLASHAFWLAFGQNTSRLSMSSHASGVTS